MELLTERLLLRPLKMEDADALYACSCGPNVGPNAGWKPHQSPEETRALMEPVFLRPGVFGIFVKQSGTLVGSIGLIDDPRREYERSRMLGYSLGEPYWGHGYMTEAGRAVLDYGFGTMGLLVISAYCYPFNARSIRVLQKLGFSYEGTLCLCEKRYDGAVLDNQCYALTAEQFCKQKKTP